MATHETPLGSKPADAERPQRKTAGRFRKGVSGNPRGRPPGSRNHSTLILQALLEGEGQEITRKVIEMAKAGDRAALALCMERLVPVRREQPLRVEIPELASAQSNTERLHTILLAVADGRLAPAEGETLASLVKTKVEAEEFDELRERVWSLEQKHRAEQAPSGQV